MLVAYLAVLKHGWSAFGAVVPFTNQYKSQGIFHLLYQVMKFETVVSLFSLVLATPIETTVLAPNLELPRATVAVLPVEISHLPILKPGEKLEFRSVNQTFAYPLEPSSNFAGVTDSSDLKWITNGTHVRAFAAYRYKANIGIGGFIYTVVSFNFMGDRDQWLAAFNCIVY